MVNNTLCGFVVTVSFFVNLSHILSLWMRVRMSDANICFRDELTQDLTTGKVCLMTGNITPIFGLWITTAVYICIRLCSEGIKKENWQKIILTLGPYVVNIYPICVYKLIFDCMCLCDSVFQLFNCQGHTQSQAHAAALDMKKPAHMDTRTVHTKTHKYTLMICFGDHVDHMTTLDG